MTNSTTEVFTNYGMYKMEVSKGGNVTFAVFFTLLLLLHLFQSIKYKQVWLGVSFFIGILLEIIGYCARALAKEDEENRLGYIVQSMGLTLAPIFIMAGYYYLLAQTATIYGPIVCLFRPIWYSYIFIFSDVLSLMMQSGGGGFVSSAQDDAGLQAGQNLMLGGLGFQVFSMTVFLLFWVILLYKVYFGTDKYVTGGVRNKAHGLDISNKDHLFNPEYQIVRSRSNFHLFPFIVIIGTVATYIRCIFKVIELTQGWYGYLMSHEIYAFLLDGAMMAIACLLLGVYYPGWVYGRGTRVVVPKTKKAQKKQELAQEYSSYNRPNDEEYMMNPYS